MFGGNGLAELFVAGILTGVILGLAVLWMVS